MMEIFAGNITASPIMAPNSAFDDALWRVEDATKPPMYRATVMLRAKPNKLGTNVIVTLGTKVPVVVKAADGTFSAPNLASFETKGMALQNIVTDDVIQALDLHIASLQQLRIQIANGSTI